MTTYAIIPKEQWEDELAKRFPHAPLLRGYKVLVFSDAETDSLVSDYKSFGRKDHPLFVEIIDHIESGLMSWVLLKVGPLKRVQNHFKPQQEEGSE